eukprot:TRINITY_DN24373_c0_g1_i1.p1 TRINITY_DN24373_c0_g1~~TRINITY_DN24373_c0_g1_i1.p1  ORF type:complete len:102 (+),score=4.61 TRINITY_DN24373_c0_g1_i1:117-422(+)
MKASIGNNHLVYLPIFVTARAITFHTIVIFVTGAKVSLSIPYSCQLPSRIKRLYIWPGSNVLEFNIITHLQPTGCISGGDGTISHVVSSNAFNSSVIAFRQ